MIQKERDRERGDTDMLFCNDIYVLSIRIISDC